MKPRHALLGAFLIAIITLSAVITQTKAGSVFSDGFESGDTSAWTYHVNHVVSTAAKHTGSYGCQMINATNGASIKADLTMTYTTLYGRSDYYFNSLTSGGDLELMAFWDSAITHAIAYLYIDATGHLCARNRSGAGYGTPVQGAVLSTGQWYEIKMNVTMGAAGKAQFWLNGASQGTTAASDNNDYGDIYFFEVGGYADSAINYYVDECACDVTDTPTPQAMFYLNSTPMTTFLGASTPVTWNGRSLAHTYSPPPNPPPPIGGSVWVETCDTWNTTKWYSWGPLGDDGKNYPTVSGGKWVMTIPAGGYDFYQPHSNFKVGYGTYKVTFSFTGGAYIDNLNFAIWLIYQDGNVDHYNELDIPEVWGSRWGGGYTLSIDTRRNSMVDHYQLWNDGEDYLHVNSDIAVADDGVPHHAGTNIFDGGTHTWEFTYNATGVWFYQDTVLSRAWAEIGPPIMSDPTAGLGGGDALEFAIGCWGPNTSGTPWTWNIHQIEQIS